VDADVRDLVAHIHSAPGKVVVAATGGGATAIGWLLAVPGGSRTILEAIVPYAQSSLMDFLGRAPANYCSVPTTREMAIRARERAMFLAPGEQVAGIGCTAGLRSDRPKRGEHRVHVAAATEAGSIVQSITLAKEQRSREGEEEVVSRLLLNTLAEAFHIDSRLSLPLLPGEAVTRDTLPGGLLARLLAGKVPAVCVEPDGRLRTDGPAPSVLLSGSFNPLHEGHLRMALVAARLTGKPAAFELSVANADKPPLLEGEVRKRLGQFAWKAPLWLTCAPTFVEKARLFPGVVFVVGVDTAVRIVQPRFYGDSVERMCAALDELRRAGAKFLVAGRLIDGKFLSLEQVEIPEACRDLFASISADSFRLDISSTQLRAQVQPG
jgi:hypothetical protein